MVICSICGESGHNKRTCKVNIEDNVRSNIETEVSLPIDEPSCKMIIPSDIKRLTLSDFEICEKIYNTHIDLNSLYNNPNGIKYLIIRSFAKKNLIEICKPADKKIKIESLKIEAFIDISLSDIITYVLSKKVPLPSKYVDNLSSELSKMCIGSSSVHQDNFNSNMNKIIRSIEISTYTKLHAEIENKLIKQLRNYMTWQWYNQKCSDLVEDMILIQPNIIQTPRKIKNIDFFVNIDDAYIFPFDLKLTIFPAGFMKDNKIKNERTSIESYIADETNHRKLLEWLYTEQNPRLFSNNYRYFIILLNLDNTEESYKLKCNVPIIKHKIQTFFTNIKKKDIIDIKYDYKKDKSKAGSYTTKCMYTLITY